MKIFNFANRQLCEYQTIFPTVASLLDHLLFTNGNGYEFDPKKGMLYTWQGKKKAYIDDFPTMSDVEWDKLIAACHEKERKFHERWSNGRAIDEVALAEDCAKYKRVSVDASMFSEESMFQELREESRNRKMEAASVGRYPSFVRPYPLSPGFADIYRLNDKSPGWLLQIAYNFCKAWEKFLAQEIKYGNVWLPPSERPGAATIAEKAQAAGMAELATAIKEDKSYDGWLDRPAPVRDYADMDYTVKHHAMIAEQAARIAKLMISGSKLKKGNKVVVEQRDPFHTYAGCAEPMPGMQGIVSSIEIAEPEAAGKIAVRFDPEVLGYERRDDDDDSITLYLRPWILKKVI